MTGSWHIRRGAGLLSLLALAALLVPGRVSAGTTVEATTGTGAAPVRPEYLDDRSTPGSLVLSLYNAIALKQYARAWSYFERKPAASYDAFAKGYAQTGPVQVALGRAKSQGAAGSSYATVPVAIAVGAGRVFAGCYLTRMQDPQIAAPDFTPRSIVSGHLVERKLADEAGLDAALPKACSDQAVPRF